MNDCNANLWSLRPCAEQKTAWWLHSQFSCSTIIKYSTVGYTSDFLSNRTSSLKGHFSILLILVRYLQQLPVQQHLPELEALGLPLDGPEILQKALGSSAFVTCTLFCGSAPHLEDDRLVRSPQGEVRSLSPFLGKCWPCHIPVLCISDYLRMIYVSSCRPRPQIFVCLDFASVI